MQVQSIRQISPVKLRVVFDEGARNNAALQNANSYVIRPSNEHAAHVFIASVEIPFDQANPSYVTLVTSETTADATYEFNVVGAIQSKNGEAITPQTLSFIGRGLRPTIKLVVARDPNTVDVIFSEAMRDEPDIRSSSRYTFDNGLSVVSVESVFGDTVRLKTSAQTAGIIYTLTIHAEADLHFGDSLPAIDSPEVYVESDVELDSVLVTLDGVAVTHQKSATIVS